MVIFGTSMLSYAFMNSAPNFITPDGREISYSSERVAGLIEKLAKDKTRIGVPANVLTEILVGLGDDRAPVLELLTNSKSFVPLAFGVAAAAELAEITCTAIKTGDKKSGSSETNKKITFDRQIVAIAKANAVTTIYSNDKNLKKFADANGIRAIGLEDLDLPDSKKQKSIDDYLNIESQPTL